MKAGDPNLQADTFITPLHAHSPLQKHVLDGETDAGKKELNKLINMPVIISLLLPRRDEY